MSSHCYLRIEAIGLTITTLSSRQFNQAASRVKKAASAGPVFITDRGEAAHVLLSIEAYRRLAGGGRDIADLLASPDAEAAELDIPAREELADAADLS